MEVILRQLFKVADSTEVEHVLFLPFMFSGSSNVLKLN
jgi:hypothetical protein